MGPEHVLRTTSGFFALHIVKDAQTLVSSGNIASFPELGARGMGYCAPQQHCQTQQEVNIGMPLRPKNHNGFNAKHAHANQAKRNR